MKRNYPEYKQLHLPTIEKEWQKLWKERNSFKRSVSSREGKPSFVFYEGPPSANGMPGIHHVISRTLKDLVCRYKTMQGFQVSRKAGWDTHGLPVELGVEKELGITKEDIGKTISVEEYNQKCREVVMRYKDQWDLLTEKMAYWVDLDDPYITFDRNYMESLWWALKALHKRGLLYKSVSIQPYSPAAGTGLSSHELNQPGAYQDVKDTSATVLFKAIQDAKFNVEGSENVYFLAWTTTPWTLPSNTGLAVGPNVDYSIIKTFNPYTGHPITVVIAEKLISKYFGEENQKLENEELQKIVDAWLIDGKEEWVLNEEHDLKKEFDTLFRKNALPYKIIKTIKGRDLEEVRYEQLMSFENNTKELSGGDPFRVVLGDYVTTEDGTGIVHTAPAFGSDDFIVGKKYNLGMFTLVDRQGKFIEGMDTYSGKYVKNYKDDSNYEDVNVEICVQLKLEGSAFKVERYEHNYPHCWRTKKPIIYYPLDAWFIKTTALQEEMVAVNKTINWKPKSTGEGRFGNWLETMVDWNLSRSRFWGTPLPIWMNEEGTEQKCIGSIQELKEEIKKSVDAGIMPQDTDIDALCEDLHKPYVDQIVLVDSKANAMYREPDLIDVWFDSGAMPFAQWHFPFGDKEHFLKNYPADFIAEGVDQTRGWFYTLHALATLLREDIIKELGITEEEAKAKGINGEAYKAVIANGLVLDKQGNKMSKSVGNVVDPFETIEKYSADATRWYLITNASPWDSLRFDIKGIEEVQRKFFGTLYNTYQFFALYANIDGFTYAEERIPLADRSELDRWIISMLQSLIKKVESSLNAYEPMTAYRAIEEFLDAHLSNWYVRLSRRRFWKGEYEKDKLCAYQTLYECLESIALMIAPVAPHFAEWLFANLNETTERYDVDSVHLAYFPKFEESYINKGLEHRMYLAQEISSLVLSLRKKENIKVRQPLQKIMIPILDAQMQKDIEAVENIIISEVNIKEIEYITETAGVIKKKIRPNFRVLGKKAGPKMKEITALIQNMSEEAILTLEETGEYILNLEDSEKFTIFGDDVEIIAEDIPGWSVASKQNITVALDIQITEGLEEEGIARELVNRLQNLRKEKDFEVTDRITVAIEDNAKIKKAIESNYDYIQTEILADALEIESALEHLHDEIQVNDILLKVSINKN